MDTERHTQGRCCQALQGEDSHPQPRREAWPEPPSHLSRGRCCRHLARGPQAARCVSAVSAPPVALVAALGSSGALISLLYVDLREGFTRWHAGPGPLAVLALKGFLGPRRVFAGWALLWGFKQQGPSVSPPGTSVQVCSLPPSSMQPSTEVFPQNPAVTLGALHPACRAPASLPPGCPRLSVQNVPVVPGAGPGPPPRPPEERPLCLPRHRSPRACVPFLSLAVPASRAVHGGHSGTTPPGALLGKADRLEA